MACQPSHAFSYVTVVWLALGVWKIPGLQVVAASLKGLVVAASLLYIIFGGYFAVAYASGERCCPGDPRGVYRAFLLTPAFR